MQNTLISQGVGQAYLVRRGQPSVRVQAYQCPDPRVSVERVRAVREASYATYARPRREVEAEIAERERRYSTPVPATATATPTYEIRTAKTPTFKPKTHRGKQTTKGASENDAASQDSKTPETP